MSEPYFIWNGTDSRLMGIVVQQYPGYQRAKERVNTVTIPGRQGALTIPESTAERIFDTMLMNCKCAVRPGSDFAKICAWLQGDGLAAFGHQPGFAYHARIINAIPFEAFCKDPHGWYTFTIPFECQPYRVAYPTPKDYLHINNAPVTRQAESGSATVKNMGDMRVPLKAYMFGSGDMGIATVDKNGSVLATVVTGVQNAVLFDWEAQEIYYLDINGNISGVATPNAMIYRDGTPTHEAQYLDPGDNTVTWQISSAGFIRDVQIVQNWRWFG